MKTYWLYLFPDVFIWTKNEKGLVYNAQNGHSLHFRYIDPVKAIVDELDLLERLYRVTITEEDLAEKDVKLWIDGVVEIEGGRIYPKEPDVRGPISFKPELRIRDNVDFYRWQHNNGIGGKIIHNLNNLIFYINGSANGSDDYYKQTIFPLKNGSTLDADKILAFISGCKKSTYLSEICLVGNVWEYPDFVRLTTRLNDVGPDVVVYCMEKDLLSYLSRNNKRKTSLLSGMHLKIVVSDYDVAVGLFDKVFRLKKLDVDYILTIKNEADYDQAFDLTVKYGLQKVEFVPLYTGANIDFFKKHIYVTRDEILNSNLSRREIFARQTVNIYAFGKLFVLPDGNVYANCNDPKIGDISDLPYDIVYREMTERNSWLLVRDQEPCNQCVYQWLCPSPSNYEKVINQTNLCCVRM